MVRRLKAFLKKYRFVLALTMLLAILWLFCLPNTLFDQKYATVVYDKQGVLLGARIANDGQWRFPPSDSVPTKFETCIRYFEDEYFYWHPGFNPVAMGKALWGNMTTDTRRGGSTLTQQVIRLGRPNEKRTYVEKIIELFKATRLEARHSKKAILALYASHAPFGGNVVGLEAASWRYFGVPSWQLSWAQMASLAILPNAPALIFPGSNDALLRKKRDRLLLKLKQKGVLNATDYALALQEPLPGKPLPLPQLAPHLVELLRKKRPSTRWNSSIAVNLQQHCNQVVSHHHAILQQNQIHNLAVLVLDVRTNTVLAYVGNAPTSKEHDPFVDIIQRNRSTGSLLKPLLFASALDEGLVLPKTLIADIPTVINGYRPENFNGDFDGAVAVEVALSRSLNIPAVRLLQRYGLAKFFGKLPKAGIKTLNRPADHYGLSLILGGAESSLWEMTNAYAGMARTLGFYTQSSSEYDQNAFEGATFLQHHRSEPIRKSQQPNVFSAGAVYNVFESLKQVNRPNGQEHWDFFTESQPIAWKTGTSFGFKDAWAVGVTPHYAIGVWAGNADGEGRPGLTGIQAAAPVLFDVLESLPPSGWFETPFDDLIKVKTCRHSGYLAGPNCAESAEQWVVNAALKSEPCPYHNTIFFDAEERFQVGSDCYPLTEMKKKSWFSLPPVLAYYYQKKHPEYREAPPLMPGCESLGQPLMQFIFPKANETILLAKDFNGKLGEVVFKLAHQQPDNEVYWYLDGNYLGSTIQFHELAISPEPGTYRLTVMDARGHSLAQRITVGWASGE